MNPAAAPLAAIAREQARDFAGARVAVFGGTGLIGANLLAALAAAGAQATCVARRAPRRRAENVRYVEASVLDGAAPPAFDYAVYVAGATSNYLDDPIGTVRLASEGLERVLDRARGARGVVYVSSGRVYGRRAEPKPLAESDCMLLPSPSAGNVYDAAKLIGEALCRRAAAAGTRAVVVRPGNIYGPWGERAPVTSLTQWIAQARAERRIVLTGPAQAVRNHVFVADVVDGLLRALAHGRAGEAYNLGSADHLSNGDLAARVAAALEPPVAVEHASSEPPDYMVLSSERARAELGFSARCAAAEHLPATVRWILESENA
ncbi:MAG TPA: NAD(P)-dependent oxidoreductase [Polyangia bacterium]|nr:NAD(P)-dependent oxidoreductase [Polyangia bacterium]